jgi:hypothetical protein
MFVTRTPVKRRLGEIPIVVAMLVALFAIEMPLASALHDVFVSPTSGLITTESGLTAAFSVALTEPPSGDVTIGVSSSDTTEGTVSTAQLTFTTTNWMDAQVVTVTGVDDLVDDGDTAYTVVLATAVGGGYDGIDPTDVTTINTDNDTAGITVTPTTGLVTTETRTTATFSVALNSEPTANVSIGVASSDTSEGTVSTAQLTFTTTNWSLAQTVTVTGVDDFVDDGDIVYTVILATAAGGGYGTVDPDDVSVTNTDNDTAGFTVAPTSGLVTTEAGGVALFTVALTSKPTGDVTVAVTSSDTSEGSVSPALLTFTTATWSAAQTVTVTGVNDSVDDGDIGYTVILGTATGGGYDTIDPADGTVTNTDNDTAGTTVTPTSGLVTTETGTTATFTVALNTEPTANVSIGVTSSNTTEGSVSPALLTFTTTNWSVAQTVTVTGVDDLVDDGDIGYTVILATATGGGYDIINPNDVTATNTDNDTAGGGGVVVTPPAGLVDTSAACPDSIATSGFADLAGFDETTIQAINCIFGYGISNGTSDVNFTPSGSVTRWQMALFLIRQIQVHGLVLPTATNQAFTDLGSYNQTTKDAISQLAQLGITQGTGNGTFSPGEAVSRWEMALFLVRFVAAVGVTMPDGSASAGFSDLSSFTAETTAAVDVLVELGIAAGTSATTFEPTNDVLRWQMALFLTRVLAVDGVVPS